MTPPCSTRRSARAIILSAFLTVFTAAAPRAQTTSNPQKADRAAIRALLVANEFAQLETLYASYTSSMRADIANEDLLVEMTRAFEFPDASLRPHLDAWVSARHSLAAYFARAAHGCAMGEHARGEKLASKTSDTQFETMHTWFDRATQDVGAALKIDSGAVPVYWVLQSMVLHIGDVDENRMVLRQALRFAPASMYTRYNYMYAVRPRWGGSYEEMNHFAEESQKFAAVNPKLRALRGFVAWDEGVELSEKDNDSAAVRKFTEALSYGDHWEFRTARAYSLYYIDREGDAIRDFNAVIATRPQYPEAWAGRALAYWSAASKMSDAQATAYLARAHADLERAVHIDRYDSDVQWAMKKILVAESPDDR